jgi:hypothetical protein
MLGGERVRRFCSPVERGNTGYSYQSLLRVLLCLFILTFATGCCYLRGYETPTDVKRWQDTEPPRLFLNDDSPKVRGGDKTIKSRSKGKRMEEKR